ncbi:MAG: hypothetical protein MUC96_12140 [Myxococcaceae bacterium]|jgi:hypothetical protein|nr:hypothetical protein [Myxococcaceae bacterium]
MRALLCVALVAAAPALAQRIGVAPFTGPNAATVRNQLVTAICDTADCVNSAKVTTANKPDWKKAKKEAVQFFVTGAVAKKGKALSLTLEVSNKPGAPKLRKSFPLGADGLAAKTLQQAIDALKGAFGGAASTVEPEDTTPPVKAEPGPAEPRPAAVTSPTTPPPAPPGPAAEATPAPAPNGPRRIPFIAGELGIDLLNRSFSYVQPVTNLRRYGLPLFPMASAKLEFYPLALSRQDVLGGLGLELSVGFAPWLRSRRESAMDDVYPTSTLRFDGGLAWRIMPSQSLNLAIIPLVGVRYHTFTVAPNAAGTRLDLLPNLAYVGLKAGLGFELGLVNDLLTLFGRFAVVPVFSSGEIISPAFFQRGSNLGLDGQFGVGVRLLGPVQLRAAFDFTRYGLTFQTEATDAFVAQGAVDQYLGGTVALRFAY